MKWLNTTAILYTCCFTSLSWSADNNYYVRLVQGTADTVGTIVPFAKKFLPMMPLLQTAYDDFLPVTPGLGSMNSPLLLHDVSPDEFRHTIALLETVQNYEIVFRELPKEKRLNLADFLWSHYVFTKNRYALLSKLLAKSEYLGLQEPIIDSLRDCLANPPYQKLIPKTPVNTAGFKKAYGLLRGILAPTDMEKKFAEQYARVETIENAIQAGLTTIDSIDNYEIKKRLKNHILDILKNEILSAKKPVLIKTISLNELNGFWMNEICFMHTQKNCYVHLYENMSQNLPRSKLIRCDFEQYQKTDQPFYTEIKIPRHDFLNEVPNQQMLDEIPQGTWDNFDVNRATIRLSDANIRMRIKLSSNDRFLAIEQYEGSYNLINDEDSAFVPTVTTIYDTVYNKTITTFPAAVNFIDSYRDNDGTEKIICFIYQSWDSENHNIPRLSSIIEIKTDTGEITSSYPLPQADMWQPDFHTICMTPKKLIIILQDHVLIKKFSEKGYFKIPLSDRLQELNYPDTTRRILAWDLDEDKTKIAIEPNTSNECYFLNITANTTPTETEGGFFNHKIWIAKYDDIPGHIIPIRYIAKFDGTHNPQMITNSDGIFFGCGDISSDIWMKPNSANLYLYEVTYIKQLLAFQQLFENFPSIPIEQLYLTAELIHRKSLSTMTVLEQKIFDATQKEYQAMLRYFLEPKSSAETTVTGSTKRSRSPESPNQKSNKRSRSKSPSSEEIKKSTS